MKVLVTGADGFVGRALVRHLLSDDTTHVVAAIRNGNSGVGPMRCERVRVSVDARFDWSQTLRAVDVVVHLAARVHMSGQRRVVAGGLFRAVNTVGTMNLACQSASAGVRRFVFVSTVKVNGSSGEFVESDPPAPADAYALSKHEAEVGLRRLAARGGMGVVIVRPPLVYGPGVAANFRSLVSAVTSGLPLPLASVDNRRSFVALSNLVSFIHTCIEHPGAVDETFFVSDGEDVSTPELLRRIGSALGRRARLFGMPPSVLVAGAAMLGRRQLAQALVSTLSVNIAKATRILGWRPQVTLDEGLRAVVQSHRSA